MVLWAYQNDHGELPSADRWYDLLIENGWARAESFACRAAGRNGKAGHFVLNENIDTSRADEIAHGTVFVFEGGAGWNQTGGPEQVKGRHRGRAIVLFTGGERQLIRPDQAGQLNWGKAAGESDRP